MPDIVQPDAAPVNGPYTPLPAGVEGPPSPPEAAPPPPPPAAPIVGQVTNNSPAPAPDFTPTPAQPVGDPMAVSKAAVGDAQAAQVDEAKAAQAEAKAQQEKNEAEAKQAEAQAAEIRKRQEDYDRQAQAQDVARGRLVDLATKADNSVANFKFDNYMDTIPGSKKLQGFIGAAISGVYGHVDPMAQINKNIAQHFEEQKAQLSSRESMQRYARQDVKDFDQHINDQRMYTEFRERNYREAVAKETEAMGLRSGNPLAAAKAQQIAAKLRADGDEKLVNMVDRYTQGEERRAHAELLARKAKGVGAGGGASNSALAELAEIASQPGVKRADIVKAAIRLKVKDPLGATKKVLDDLNIPAEEKAAKVDEKLIVHDVDGTPLGLSSGGRAVPQIQKDLRTLPRAIEQLKQLRDANDWKMTTKDPRFHNAVLAVASTTSAGSTDANVNHEKGSLTNAIGLPNNDAIDRKLAELENQLAETKAQMNPLPDDYVAPARGGGAAKTTSVAMPDGTIQQFDASGKRVK